MLLLMRTQHLVSLVLTRIEMLFRRDQDGLCNTWRAKLIHDKEHPVAGNEDARIFRQRHFGDGVGRVKELLFDLKGNATLVRIDGMACTGNSN